MHRTTTRESRLGRVRESPPPCSQSMVRRFSYSHQAGLSHHHSVHGQEILLLATMRQTTTRYVQPGASKKSPHHTLNDDNRAWWANSLTHPRLDSLVIVGCLVRRFSYSPQRTKRRQKSSLGQVRESPNHALSSFRAWWGDSPTHPRLDICRRRLARSGE